MAQRPHPGQAPSPPELCSLTEQGPLGDPANSAQLQDKASPPCPNRPPPPPRHCTCSRSRKQPCPASPLCAPCVDSCGAAAPWPPVSSPVPSKRVLLGGRSNPFYHRPCEPFTGLCTDLLLPHNESQTLPATQRCWGDMGQETSLPS